MYAYNRLLPKDLCLTASLSIITPFFRPVSSRPPGCLRDLRFNGRPIPLDQEEPSEGIQVVTSQGVSTGCSSDACRKHQCSPPLVCLDLWRHHECRCCKYTEEITQHDNDGSPCKGTLCAYLHTCIQRRALSTAARS